MSKIDELNDLVSEIKKQIKKPEKRRKKQRLRKEAPMDCNRSRASEQDDITW